ncbi:acetyl-CoA carboxylase biotin carboxyl carrier protein subunit [Staphylococcus simiae]|uniref:acetyl-CoA carboxylase biotin carboxyl carrier protein n=1 Tax=Staphylococcus simiae TaxID=308354 RepID=UPI001A95CC84|nr:biotin/lipoyl-containing protein [Staphylococcus simiae]MBO1197999.1 acetyl-CoA carboxylase biotin carboxyl carrier protein subunit [Staphylococcus simiae]MBO1200477.1 acetyl-CoA carboxylase biotin carboxyl carrier protein subunit [Staphylococcus simiae]MBO1202749.1 acetyl-CoA carboxylase biotin carboxyl carrier protein subunit [Staphylococcus simiae]MBO1209990.1 acetyl-CoA carboxylase biotin carboxyl carrier protein subunit [Staphylococcus simiae]MBO1228894.1 acetyl-CoA carboxylase biotin 
MKIEQIEQLIKLVKENDVVKFKYKNFEDEIEIDFTTSQQEVTQHAVTHSNVNEEATTSNKTDKTDHHKEIKSPMVGTFYLQDSKELTEPMINVGDVINEGDIIGYVEAMKVLNEIPSDVSGEVQEIVVNHGSNVEYDQVLVRVK